MGSVVRGGAVSAQGRADASVKVQVQSLKVPTLLKSQAEAEACFLKAIEIARQQQAKSWNSAQQ